MASNEGILCSHLYNFYAQHVDGDDNGTVHLEKHKAFTKSEMYRILQGFLSGQAAKETLGLAESGKLLPPKILTD